MKRNHCRAERNALQARITLNMEIAGASKLMHHRDMIDRALFPGRRRSLAQKAGWQQERPHPAPKPRKRGIEDAADWLRNLLEREKTMDGLRVKAAATQAGISERTLYRAAKRLGVRTLGAGFGKARLWHLCPCDVCRGRITAQGLRERATSDAEAAA